MRLPPVRHRRLFPLTLALAIGLLGISGCARVERRPMVATGYCRCGECNGWERGSWIFLQLDFWHRYVNYGPHAGEPYTGRTASGAKLRAPNPGLVSVDSLGHPWMIPVRLGFFPWLLLPHPGTIAADTDFYPFGTEMHVPGWGRGVVEDRGGAIKGPDRIDLLFSSHGRADDWGRQNVDVEIVRPR